MLKSTVILTVLVFIAASAYTDPFSPNVMVLSAPDKVYYDFSGNALSIPVTVTGTPADVSFCVFTKNQGSKISKVTNGYLGWHYVNKIDTCVYVSPSNQMVTGANAINWDGKDESGAAVPPGEYAYYLFGYDNKSAKQLVTLHIKNTMSWNGFSILEKDEEGKPLARPIMYEQKAHFVGSTDSLENDGIVRKWIVGNDPADPALLETTMTKGGEDTAGNMAVLPTDNSKIFIDVLKSAGVKATRKWGWIPNGQAVLDTTWGAHGEYTYNGSWPEGWDFGPGVVSDGSDRLFLSNADISNAGTESQLIVINAADGSEVKQLDISQWWVNPADAQAGGQNCGGPTNISFRNGLIALDANGSCLNSVMDPYAETTDDAVLWVNRNGDLIGDKNWEPISPRPWVCNEYNLYPYKYETAMDDQGFVIFSAYGYQHTGYSFGLYAPDGTGVAYKNYAFETWAGDSSVHSFVDYGSPYDGIYTSEMWRYQGMKINFIAHDSIKGVITNRLGVNEAVPTAFSVAQNVPNPFNPTTIITFNLAKTGKVTVDVFNVAGQKVASLVNGSVNAGSHSVTWNASKFSAGVYFYTVKSGVVSRTMKMTLLK
jgi:flagellar hook assembly protein FlgD